MLYIWKLNYDNTLLKGREQAAGPLNNTDQVCMWLQREEPYGKLLHSVMVSRCFIFLPVQVELELRAQVRQFVELMGHLPHHMDGHQHVHVLPGNA